MAKMFDHIPKLTETIGIGSITDDSQVLAHIAITKPYNNFGNGYRNLVLVSDMF